MSQDLLGSLLPLVVLFAIFYFMIIKPQQKQQKEHQSMIDNLQKGDKIVTNGGLLVEIVKVEDDILTVTSAKDGAKLRLVRSYVASKWED